MTKKYLKAHVDISTGKIHGCPKNSWKWFHEKGHIVFNDVRSWLLMVKSYLFDIWMLAVSLSFIFNGAIIAVGLTWFFYTFITLYEENWCNKYADKHYRGKR